MKNKSTIVKLLKENGIRKVQYGHSSIRGFTPILKSGFDYVPSYDENLIDLVYVTKEDATQKHREILNIFVEKGFKAEFYLGNDYAGVRIFF